MTDEDRQRQMDFLLEQQAQFAVDIQALREAQTRTDQQLAMYAETQSKFIQIATRSIQALVDSQLRTDEQLSRMAERMAQADERMAQADERSAQADERSAQMDERMARTDERLNVLINIVERHISAGHDNVG